ncbi:hypothetical protein [Segniliparus rugosus]|uniref:Uncharacterized protein n=1 Tax=Segniliparus rugosus (strain ATCC BAA-974 / DSM 45345 / CCUG 50838 / CIP 108380 / JCM 13579 / CDC 945) TaxID=679197 RepID=U1N555_SEGRC|nr:hypothetical protein [Segniliparus rugosus]ERG69299.1 hypothetical protein HMPREF9336_04190 [Segniliparus rugosus ATCC BAA-974]
MSIIEELESLRARVERLEEKIGVSVTRVWQNVNDIPPNVDVVDRGGDHYSASRIRWEIRDDGGRWLNKYGPFTEIIGGEK